MTNVPSVSERNEIVQDIIDRLLYLSDSERKEFLNYIDILKEKYYIKYRLVDGIRIYELTK